MTQEDKQLLLADLSARLTYRVICQVDDGAAGLNAGKLVEIDISKELVRFDVDYWWDAYIDDIKPYLRPMSSMTDEERYELQEIIGKDVEILDDFIQIVDSSRKRFAFLELQAVFDWLNAHHFDYRSLIEKGLAIEVTKENNPYEN